MKVLKTAVALFACSALLVLGTGCTPTPNPDPTPTPTTEDCALNSVKESAVSVKDLVYDAQHRLIKQSYYLNGLLDGSEEFTYDATGKIIKKVNRNASAVSTGYTLYEYNAAGNLSSAKVYSSSGSLNYQYDYIYSGAQLMRKNEFYLAASGGQMLAGDYYTYQYAGGDKPNRVNAFFTPSSYSLRPVQTDYTYDTNNNIINESSILESSRGTQTVVRTFDTKKSTLISFAGLYPTAVTGTVSPNGIAGKNNVVSERVTTYYTSGSSSQTSIETNYTYGFDTKGNVSTQAVLPTNGAAKNYNFGYHCH